MLLDNLRHNILNLEYGLWILGLDSKVQRWDLHNSNSNTIWVLLTTVKLNIPWQPWHGEVSRNHMVSVLASEEHHHQQKKMVS